MEGFVDIKVERWFTVNTNLAPVFSDIADIMLDSVLENFASGGRPDKWAPLKGGGASFLYDTGALRQSLQREYDETSASVSTDTPYAKFHQFGTKWMPIRSFLEFQDEDKEAITEKLMGKGGIIIFTDAEAKPE